MHIEGRSILAHFPSRERAEEAAGQLRREGFTTVQVDRISRYGDDDPEDVLNPLTGDMTGLGPMTQGLGPADPDERVLVAADPAAHGLAHEGTVQGGIRERAYQVTVVAYENELNRAVQILEDAGGEV